MRALNSRTGKIQDPAPAWKFYVELQGIIVAEFTECSGLSMEREVHEYREGGVNDFVHILPGPTKYGRITLKRGISFSHALWEWCRAGIFDGKVKRVNLSIILGNAEGKKAKHWDVLDAFPVKYTGPSLTSDSAQIAIESIEIAHHGLNLSTETGTSMGRV